jgi:hypothetical protein
VAQLTAAATELGLEGLPLDEIAAQVNGVAASGFGICNF